MTLIDFRHTIRCTSHAANGETIDPQDTSSPDWAGLLLGIDADHLVAAGRQQAP